MEWAEIKQFRTKYCPKCDHLLAVDATPRCKLIGGTNCEHAIETGVCRYQEASP